MSHNYFHIVTQSCPDIQDMHPHIYNVCGVTALRSFCCWYPLPLTASKLQLQQCQEYCGQPQAHLITPATCRSFYLPLLVFLLPHWLLLLSHLCQFLLLSLLTSWCHLHLGSSCLTGIPILMSNRYSQLGIAHTCIS